MSQLQLPMHAPLTAVRGSSQTKPINWFDLSLKTVLMVSYAAIIYLAWKTGRVFNPFAHLFQFESSNWFLIAATAYSSTMLVVTAIRALYVIGYRPQPSLSDADLPFVSVIIPAYNEVPDVAKSIESIAQSNYPREKLQIICIDDGSKDDTWLHMEAAASKYKDNVCAIRMEKNGGKRQGLRVGFALAAGDVLVTMDSDSVVESDALRNLVTPIASDPRVGGVAGNVKVLNRDAGIIPRMLRASFVLAFDFTRAYQSQIRTVSCTPGAFSAYRRTAVEAVLDAWNNQTWCGKPSTIAEDRALSNLILKDGHEILFQSNAVVWTNVPTTYKGLTRMFMRWERGNLRENLTYAGFCWKPFRDRYWVHANLDFLVGFSEMVLPGLLIAASLVYMLVNPFFALQYLAMTIIFGALMQIYYIKQEKNTDFIYGIFYNLFYFTALWWVVPYSVLTANNGSWMTRTLPATAAAPAASETPVAAAASNSRLAA